LPWYLVLYQAIIGHIGVVNGITVGNGEFWREPIPSTTHVNGSVETIFLYVKIY